MNKKIVKILLCVTLIAVLSCSALALVACDDQAHTFKKDRTFAFDFSSTYFMGFEPAVVKIVAADLLFDTEETYLTFKSDGTVQGQLKTQAGLFGRIDDLLERLGALGIDMTMDDVNSMIATIDLAEGLEFYAEPMFPGFTDNLVKGDIAASFDLIEDTLGLNIAGLDFSKGELHEAIVAMGNEYKQNKTLHLPSNLLDIIPKDAQLALTINWQYSLEHLKGEDGKEYDAIYIGGPVAHNAEQTQPFAILTMSENSKGTAVMHLVIEFMNIDLGFIEV